MATGIGFKRMPHPRERDASGLRAPVPAATASDRRLLRGIGAESTAFRPPNPESAGAVPVGRILVGNVANVARGIYGLSPKPVERTPYMAPSGGIQLSPASPAPPPQPASAGMGAALQPPMGLSAPRGPMASITGLSPMESRTGVGLRLMDRYNSAAPRSAGRVDALSETFERVGVPVIGSALGDRAPMETGAEVARRYAPGLQLGAGTRAKIGSLPPRPTGGLDVSVANRDAARLVETGTDGQRVSGRGIGMFSRDRVRRNPSREDRALAANIALEQAKGAGQVEAANINAGAERYKADRTAEIERAKIEAQNAVQGIRMVNGVPVKQDGSPLDDKDQRSWAGRTLAINSLNSPDVLAKAKQWKKNPDAFNPVIDRTTGKFDFMPANPRFDIGAPEWSKEKASDGGARYVTPYEYDPVVAGIFFSNYGI